MTSQASHSKFSVAIVGGGIGGLCLAIGLLENPDIDVQIYEAAHAFGEVGLGVNIAPNSQRALSLISPKVEASFLAEATSNMWKSHEKYFATIMIGLKGPDDGKIVTRQLNSSGAKSVHRAKFLNNLIQHVPTARAHFNKRLVSVKEGDSSGKLLLTFKDGSTAEADCVVGADGIHSVVRKHILGADHPTADPKYTGTACFRAIIPMQKASERLGAEYAQNCHLLCGPKAAIFSYPVEHGDRLNIIAMHFEHLKWEGSSWIAPSSREELNEIFKGWNETAEGIVDLMASNDVSAWAMHDQWCAPFYNKGRVCIMGDAAHATTPFQGQGAGQAIEDALVLKNLLGAVETTSQLRAAFHAFDLARRARSERVVTTSRHAGQIYGFLAENIGSDVQKMKAELDHSYRWMWNRDHDDQIREALVLFHEALDESV